MKSNVSVWLDETSEISGWVVDQDGLTVRVFPATEAGKKAAEEFAETL